MDTLILERLESSQGSNQTKQNQAAFTFGFDSDFKLCKLRLELRRTGATLRKGLLILAEGRGKRTSSSSGGSLALSSASLSDSSVFSSCDLHFEARQARREASVRSRPRVTFTCGFWAMPCTRTQSLVSRGFSSITTFLGRRRPCSLLALDESTSLLCMFLSALHNGVFTRKDLPCSVW